MLSNKYQRGMSMSSWMIVIALAGFFLTLFFKIGPAYLDNMSVRSALASMTKSGGDIQDMEKSEIYRSLTNYFTINGVRNVRPRDLKIVRKREFTLINHEYETRIPLFLNIDVVLTFRNQVDSSNLDQCCKYLVEDGAKSKKAK